MEGRNGENLKPLPALGQGGDFALLPAKRTLPSQGDSLPPKRKCPAKVATKWPLGTLGGVKSKTPQTSFCPMSAGF